MGKSAARFEGAGVLQEFQFKDEADRIQAEVGAGDFENGRAADMRPDDFLHIGDLLAIYGRDGHCGKYLSAYIAPSWGCSNTAAYGGAVLL